MPVLFLVMFVQAVSDDRQAPNLRIGVEQGSLSSIQIDALVDTGIVDIKPLEASFDQAEMNIKEFEGIFAHDKESGELTLFVAPSFGDYGKIVSQTAFGTVNPVLGVKELPSANDPYLAFIVPGLFVMILIQIAATSTANIVLMDRADGSLRIISSIKGAILPLFGAELSFRLLFTLLNYFVILFCVLQFTDFDLTGRFFAFTATFVLGAMMMIAFGYALGGIVPSQRNWSAVITVVGLACWFFSDILFQASQHDLARPIALLLPPTYLTDALRQIATQSPGTFSLEFDLAMITAWLVGLSALAMRFFSFETTDDRM